MIRSSILVTLVGLTVAASPKECLEHYGKFEALLKKAEAKERKDAKRVERLKAIQMNPKIVKELYQPMFVKQFETEFTIQLADDFKAMFQKLLFDPASITPSQWNELRSGFPHDTKVSEENPTASLLKNYLSLNHLTLGRQEQSAEAILSKSRKKNVQLTQLEMVALRVARVIGRDYDFFESSPYKVNDEVIRDMKARFLSLFSFDGKTLSNKELDDLFDANVTVDDPVSTQRYDISQVYNFKYKVGEKETGIFNKKKVAIERLYITNEMIEARNERVLLKAEKYKNPKLTAEINKKLENPVLKKGLDELNIELEKDHGLAESMRYVRLLVRKQTGEKNPFKTSDEFGKFVEDQIGHMQDGLAKLNSDPKIEGKIKFLVQGLKENTTYAEHMKALEARIDYNRSGAKDLVIFMKSDLGKRLFEVVREEYARMEPGLFQSTPKIGLDEIKTALERNVGLLEETVAMKRNRPDLFEAGYQFKLIRTGLTKTEVTEIFKIAQRNPAMRLLALVGFDPFARYGFCFGRAFFFNRILDHHGIDAESLGKVLVDGKMSGGLTGWSWHIAQTVEKEGGGMWVLDQSHGEPQDVRTWFNHYRDHEEGGKIKQGASKDDRIKIFFTPGDRFGRQFWGEQDFDTNLVTQYESILNKLGADHKYFRDVEKSLKANNYNDEAYGEAKKLVDGMLDALRAGF